MFLYLKCIIFHFIFLPSVCSQSNIIIFRSYFDNGFPWSFAISLGDTIATRFIFASKDHIYSLFFNSHFSVPLVASSLVTVSMGQVEEGSVLGVPLSVTRRLSRFWECRVFFTTASTLTKSKPDSFNCSKALYVT